MPKTNAVPTTKRPAMSRLDIYIPTADYNTIQQLAADTDVSKAHIIRRILKSALPQLIKTTQEK